MSESNGNPLTALSNAMADAVERAGAATVMVDARRRLPASGIAYTSEFILTADHVVERDEDIRITLQDGSRLSAVVAGRDSGSDLALLRLEKAVASPAEAAPERPRLGQLVLALGRPSADGIQASLGVVSALGGQWRTGRGGMLEGYLRTDTIPYPGFSGGPLIDAAGRVLGLNTSGLARGVSLTIPQDLAWRVAETLAQHGHVRRGFLGIRSQPVELPEAQQNLLERAQESGLLVVGVERGSPADQAGMLVGDILTAINGRPVADADQLFAQLVGEIVGKAAELQVLRGGRPASLTVTVGERK